MVSRAGRARRDDARRRSRSADGRRYLAVADQHGWLAQSFYLHWKYTADARFLRDRAYPWCAEAGRALLGVMTPDSAGRLKLPLSSSPEIFDNSPRSWLPPNSNYDLTLIRFLFEANREMASALGDHDRGPLVAGGARRAWIRSTSTPPPAP